MASTDPETAAAFAALEDAARRRVAALRKRYEAIGHNTDEAWRLALREERLASALAVNSAPSW